MTHNESARDCMRRLHERRKALGLCVYCARPLDADETHLSCASCRAEKNSSTREKKKQGIDKLLRLNDIRRKIREREDQMELKCWGCVWGKYLDDRFYCPFPEGICAKAKQEEKHED